MQYVIYKHDILYIIYNFKILVPCYVFRDGGTLKTML